MYTNYFSRSMNHRLALATSPGLLIVFLVIAAIIWFVGCNKDSSPTEVSTGRIPEFQFESTGEEFLISVLNEIESITEFVLKGKNVPKVNSSFNDLSQTLPPKERKLILSSTSTDTIYIYGEVTSDGYGAIVTERHAYPKGLLLITVRKTHGKPPTKVVTQTKRYITYQDFLNDTTQQSNITEVYGLSGDTIVTHVLRNGVIETYTFRLPVITRVVNPRDGSIRVTYRYGANGAIYSEVLDGDGNLIQVRITQGESNGCISTYTEFPDASWRSVRVIGQADGSIFREITSGP